jgi:hypothetical protein
MDKSQLETVMDYVEPKAIAAQVRANIKQAQKDGTLDPKWKISVRTERASLCSSVNVRIQGDDLTSEWLFRPVGDHDPRGSRRGERWSWLARSGV